MIHQPDTVPEWKTAVWLNNVNPIVLYIIIICTYIRSRERKLFVVVRIYDQRIAQGVMRNT